MRPVRRVPPVTRRTRSRHGHAGLALALWLLAASATAVAQTSPWAVDGGRERVRVTNGGAKSVWTTDRVQVSWVRPESGGWFAAVERQTRGSAVNVTPSVRGYARLGAWTVAGGGGVTPDAIFQYRYSVDAELSRRVVGTLVAGAGYRFLAFNGQDLHQWQPSLTWYHPKG